MATANKRRYVFHFDLENTILMKDTANGINLNDNVSNINIKLISYHILLLRYAESSAKVLGVRCPRKKLQREMKRKRKLSGT